MPCFIGDSTTDEVWQRAMGGLKADALVTDPPYCLLTRRRKGGDEREPKGRKIERGPLTRFPDVRAYKHFTRAWLSRAVKYLAAKAPLVIWTNLLGKEPITTVANELGFSTTRGEYVWAKRTREGNSGEELLRVVETALVFSREGAPLVTPQEPSTPWAVVAGYDDDDEGTRWGSHPSHKPFGVLEPLVRTWTQVDQLVVDCFAGSGSIPAACLRLGRGAVAIEALPEWAARVTERMESR